LSTPKIPDPMSRRYLIEREIAASEALAIAEAYLADERASEAIVFLAKAGASERLAGLATQAIEQGDAFLLREVARATGREPSAAQWLALADAAERAGRLLYAVTARRQATRGDDSGQD
jgi:sulfite reductase beta subunit-like hemoprotein